jgi:hypothetical protein
MRLLRLLIVHGLLVSYQFIGRSRERNPGQSLPLDCRKTLLKRKRRSNMKEQRRGRARGDVVSLKSTTRMPPLNNSGFLTIPLCR